MYSVGSPIATTTFSGCVFGWMLTASCHFPKASLAFWVGVMYTVVIMTVQNSTQCKKINNGLHFTISYSKSSRQCISTIAVDMQKSLFTYSILGLLHLWTYRNLQDCLFCRCVIDNHIRNGGIQPSLCNKDHSLSLLIMLVRDWELLRRQLCKVGLFQ